MQLFKKESFLKIRLICCAVPEPGCLTLGFPGFVCRDLKSGMVTAMPKHKAKIISTSRQQSWQIKSESQLILLH